MVAMTGLSLLDLLPCREPFDRHFLGRVVKTFAGFPRARRLAVRRVAVPCLLADTLELLPRGVRPFHTARWRNPARSKSAHSSRLMRTIKLRLNAAVTPSGSS